ncbi:MAG: hypothetical protein ABIN24_14925 [Dyadobacter sp.]
MFDDITCNLGRYTNRFFDCSKNSKMFDNPVYSFFNPSDPFPIFTQNIFKKSQNGLRFPYEIFDFKERTGIRKDANSIHHSGRIVVLKKKIAGRNTNYFFIWISEALWNRFTNMDSEIDVNVHINFHPVGHVNEPKVYPDYFNESLAQKIANTEDAQDRLYKDNKFFDNNFFQLGVRYLFAEKQAVLQQRCSLNNSKAINLSTDQDGIPIMLIIPVSSGNPYFGDLSNATNLKNTIKSISDCCFEIACDEKLKQCPAKKPNIGRVACSFYSRSGMIAEQLLVSLPAFINEFYFFDIMLDKFHTDSSGKKVMDRTQDAGFSAVWRLIEQWKRENSDKKIRIYSAYPSALLPICNKIKRGKFEEILAAFTSFNGKNDKVRGKYFGLINGYEIYNEDKSISLVSLPVGNFLHYLDETRNPGGFGVKDHYSIIDDGHSWFLSRLQTHALYHSNFS